MCDSLFCRGAHVGRPLTQIRFASIITVNVLPPIEAGASCFNENSATDSKELRRLTLSPQA